MAIESRTVIEDILIAYRGPINARSFSGAHVTEITILIDTETGEAVAPPHPSIRAVTLDDIAVLLPDIEAKALAAHSALDVENKLSLVKNEQMNDNIIRLQKELVDAHKMIESLVNTQNF